MTINRVLFIEIAGMKVKNSAMSRQCQKMWLGLRVGALQSKNLEGKR
jgi:hypothetical protein